MSDTRYFHGTVNRLITGDLLLPPDITKRIGCSTVDSAYSAHRNDRVYITTSYHEAVSYSLTQIQPNAPEKRVRKYAGRGFVYEVEPIGRLELDPDYDGPEYKEIRNEFVMCEKARIIAEYRPRWDMVALRCLRQMIENQNDISLYRDWPRTKEELMAA